MQKIKVRHDNNFIFLDLPIMNKKLKIYIYKFMMTGKDMLHDSITNGMLHHITVLVFFVT